MAEWDSFKADFDLKWGDFRKAIARHPLTAFWSALVLGLVIGAVVFP